MTETRRLIKGFDQVVMVGLTFSVRPSEVTGSPGHNGATTTTALRMVLGPTAQRE